VEVRYACNGDAAGAWNYLNPLFQGHLNASCGWRWYLGHPAVGATTLMVHIFNVFNVTSLFTYIRDLNPPYGVLPRHAYWEPRTGSTGGACANAGRGGARREPCAPFPPRSRCLPCGSRTPSLPVSFAVLEKP
jgi:hypothetical protein